MRKYVLRRLASSVPTLLGITVVIFVAMRVLPGDPVAMIASEGQGTYALRGEELARARATPRPRPAVPPPVPRLDGRRPPRRPRPVVLARRADPRPDPPPRPHHRPDRAHGRDPLVGHRHPGRHRQRGVAPLGRGPRHPGRRHGLHGRAELLGGPGDRARRRPGLHLAAAPDHRLLLGRPVAQPPDDARARRRPGGRARRRHGPHHPLVGAGGARGGLRPHGPRQGPGRAADRLAPRPEERAAADRHRSPA